MKRVERDLSRPCLLFFLGWPNPFPGAAWTRISSIAKKCSRRGFLVEIVGAFTYKTFSKIGGKNLRQYNIFNMIFQISVKHPLFFVLNVFMSAVVSTIFLIARRPQVAIVSIPPGDTGIGSIIACKLTKTRFIVDYRDEWEDYLESQANSNIDKTFYANVKKIVSCLYSKSNLMTVVTPDFALSLERRGVSKVKLVPNGAELSIFHPRNKHYMRKKLDLAENDFVIVYTGFIGGYYKLETVIRAIARLRSRISNIKLLMVGEGSDLQSLLHLSNKMSLQNNVFYLGVKKNQHEVAEIICASDVGIIPGAYTKGQLAVKFFEYCACSTTVIAIVPEDSALGKIIKDHKIGLTVSSMSEKKLAEALYQLHVDEAFREGAGKRAKSLIEEEFDRCKISKEFIKLLENML